MQKRPYEKPQVTVYEAKEIVELLGPAQAAGASSACGDGSTDYYHHRR